MPPVLSPGIGAAHHANLLTRVLCHFSWGVGLCARKCWRQVDHGHAEKDISSSYDNIIGTQVQP